MTPQELQASLESIIYAADEPATLDQIAKALGVEKAVARAALDLLTATYQTDERGIEVRKVAGGWKFYTKAQHHDVVRKFIKSLQPPLRLTMPALETLAVIAYKQPATVPEINEIRGVNVGGVIKTLLEKRLITTAGRKEVIGRPILYRTSKQFMMRFGLSDLDELPSLKEFEALAQAALGDDAGIAPNEPESEAVGEKTESATTEDISIGDSTHELAVEAGAADISGEQSAERETMNEIGAESNSEPNAEAAAEIHPGPEEPPTEKSRAAAANAGPDFGNAQG